MGEISKQPSIYFMTASSTATVGVAWQIKNVFCSSAEQCSSVVASCWDDIYSFSTTSGGFCEKLNYCFCFMWYMLGYREQTLKWVRNYLQFQINFNNFKMSWKRNCKTDTLALIFVCFKGQTGSWYQCRKLKRALILSTVHPQTNYGKKRV